MANLDAPDTESATRQHHLTDAIRQTLREHDTPGAAVALTVDGQPIFAAGVGSRDLAHATPLAADAPFYIYSVTKLLLAATALQLAERERLTLDAPVETYLPALPLPQPVTVRQLLNHTGGLPDYGGMPAYSEAVRATPGLPWTSDEFLTRTLAGGLAFPPGQGWRYSNIGYLIIRLLVERLTGLPLREALRQAIFAPLALRHTVVAETLNDAHTLTPGYSAFFSPDGALLDVALRYHPGWVSHGVVISTAPELARILDTLFAGTLLRSDSLAQMLTAIPVPVRHPWFHAPAYGLGVMTDARSPYGLVAGHGGGGPGYDIAALHFADVHGHRVTSVALANRDQPELGMRLAFALVEALRDSPR